MSEKFYHEITEKQWKMAIYSERIWEYDFEKELAQYY